MPCTNPVHGFHKRGGGFTMHRNESVGFKMHLPCNFCIGCRIDKQNNWSLRQHHEHKMYTQRGQPSSFVHLTYSDEHLPADSGLDKIHVEKFLHAVRDKVGYKQKIRFFAAGEYGDQNNTCRPHYHINLFGIDFTDKVMHKKSDKGNHLFTSETLENLWGRGFALTSEITHASIRYAAKYVLKSRKQMYKTDAVHPRYLRIMGDQTIQVPYEFQKQSLGLGKDFCLKYMTDLFPSGFAIVDGKKVGVPQYYKTLCEKHRPDLYEKYQKDHPYEIETIFGQDARNNYRTRFNNEKHKRNEFQKQYGVSP